jgi:hypothetical protein
MNERRNDLEIAMERAIVLRDPTRIDLLFTMSEIPHADPWGSRMRSDVSRTIVLVSVAGPSSPYRASTRQPSLR